MSLSGDVQITVNDNGGGTVIVPSASLQVVMGTSSAGTAATVVATRSLSTLTSTFGYGPLPEAAALAILGGGTVLAIKVATNTAGAFTCAGSPVNISGATNATPIVVTTSDPHGFTDGFVVTVASVGGNTAANGTWVVDVQSSTTFVLRGSAGSGAYTSGGTATFTGSVQSGSALTTTGVSSMYFSGTPNDTTYAIFTVTRAGTVGTAGIAGTFSLDAGRQTGPTLVLGTATTLTFANTGLTLNFESGKTLAVGDTVRVATSAPTWNTAGVTAAIDALAASPYATGGWGSMHLCGTCSGANATTIAGYVESALAAAYMFTRIMLDVRDALTPTGWGGAGETDSTWMTSILSDFASVSQRRGLAGAGYYNMPSAFNVPSAGAPSYRRPLTWALAARTVGIPPQRHAGKVADGSLSQIVVDVTRDPSDGFIYHDERINPGLDILTGGSGRFTSARTRLGYGNGFFIVNPLLLSPLGSQFTMLPYGNVMDIACSIVHQTGQSFINADVRTNPNGTIYENDAVTIEQTIFNAIRDQMISTNEISGAVVAVDRTNNILTTSNLNITVTIRARGYVLQETVTIQFGDAQAA